MYYSGQLIKAKVNSVPLIYHYGLLLVEKGEVKVLHNTPFRSSVIDTLDVWLSTREFVSVTDTHLNQYPNDFIINRFDNQCKKDYNLFQYNCEHFIDCMLNQKQKSEQVRKWSLGVGLTVLVLCMAAD